MKTKEIKLYEYSELSKEAKEKALNDWNTHSFDDYELMVELDNYLDELLEQNDIQVIQDLKGYESKHAKIYYSLGYSQGDGAMFEGVFMWGKLVARVKQSGHYYHFNSKEIELTDSTRDGEEATEEEYKAFDDLYVSICKKLEKRGYETIEDIQSEAHFIEDCNANEYTFREDGTMENL